MMGPRDPMTRHRHPFAVVISVLAVLAASGCTALAPSVSLDQQILGTWLPDPEYDRDPPSKSTYYADGSMRFVAYASDQCEYLMSATGRWVIRGRMLHIYIDQSTNANLLPTGLEIVDEIISINAMHKVLKSTDADDDELQYRLKGDICK